MRSVVRAIGLVVIVGVVAALPAGAQNKDIVDTAVAAGSFKTLAKALEAAGWFRRSTGATGNIGGRLLRHLEDDGHAVVSEAAAR